MNKNNPPNPRSNSCMNQVLSLTPCNYLLITTEMESLCLPKAAALLSEHVNF